MIFKHDYLLIIFIHIHLGKLYNRNYRPKQSTRKASILIIINNVVHVQNMRTAINRLCLSGISCFIKLQLENIVWKDKDAYSYF